jgi:hypothetical protein
MMSGMPLETCWAFNKRWNNKFYYKVASSWLFLLIRQEKLKLHMKIILRRQTDDRATLSTGIYHSLIYLTFFLLTVQTYLVVCNYVFKTRDLRTWYILSKYCSIYFETEKNQEKRLGRTLSLSIKIRTGAHRSTMSQPIYLIRAVQWVCL